MKFKIIFLVIIFSTIYIESKSQCRGSITCKICTNCSRCRYCSKEGGSCGACNGNFNNESKLRQSNNQSWTESKNRISTNNYEDYSPSKIEKTKEDEIKIENLLDSGNHNFDSKEIIEKESKISKAVEVNQNLTKSSLKFDSMREVEVSNVERQEILKTTNNQEKENGGISFGWLFALIIIGIILYDILKKN